MGDRGGLVGDRPPFPEMTRGLRQLDVEDGSQKIAGWKSKRGKKHCGNNLIFMLYLACESVSPQRLAGLIEDLNRFGDNTQKRSIESKYKRFGGETMWQDSRSQLAEYVDNNEIGLAAMCCRRSCSIDDIRGFC